MNKEVHRSENSLLVFISSRMNKEMERARSIAVEAIEKVAFGRPWAFESSPASAQTAEDTYLRKVREADFVVWLVGSETTQSVVDEINEAIASARKLLVFQLPAEQRDSQTNELIDRVGSYAKWSKVNIIENLSVSITEAVADAVIQAVRNPIAPARREKLLQDVRLSIYRCKVALVSLGAEETVAEEMANDRARGNILGVPTHGAFTVVGVQGSGKSLAVERLFQGAALDAAEDSSRWFPVFVRALDLAGPLSKHIEECLQGYADPHNPRVLVIIDGVDELGPSRAMDILRQVTAYVDANPEATLIATARLLPGMRATGRLIEVPPMEDDKSLSLMEKVLDRPIHAREMHRWPQSIREARRIPQFAVMLAALLRHNPDLAFASPGQIIGQLADQLLRHEEDNPEELDRLLQLLAFRAIESGARVNPNLITVIRAKQALLKTSRLIEESSDYLDFTLAVFREWYAARALIEGTADNSHLQSISDRWIPPLSVVLNSEVDEIGEGIIAHIVASDPGLAGVLLKENTPDPIRLYGKIPAVANAQSSGTKIREAMALWKTGLKDLYKQIGPATTGGEVSPLAVKSDERCLTISWYAGQSELANIVELADRPLSPASPSIHQWDIERELSGPSWWSYFKTQEQLSDSLDKMLRNHSLASESHEFRLELAWNVALHVWREGELHQETLGIEKVLQYLRTLEPNTVVKTHRGRVVRPRNLEVLAEHLSTMVEQGATGIANPWPSADLPVISGPIWNCYSSERLLERTKQIYAGALRIYVSIVEKWFAPFCRRLSLYRILPVRLEGWVRTGQRPWSANGGPVLDWYLRILPEVQENEVSFELDFGRKNSDAEFFDGDDLYKQEQSAFETHRSGLPGAFRMTLTSSALLEVLDPYPATELAHSWLRRDLKELGW